MLWLDYETLTHLWPEVADHPEAVLREKLDEADLEIRAKFPDLAARIDRGLIELSTVQRVIKRVVLRAVRHEDNPASRLQGQSFTTGPFTQSVQFTKPDNGDVYLSKSDREALAVGRDTKSGRAFSIYMGGVR